MPNLLFLQPNLGLQEFATLSPGGDINRSGRLGDCSTARLENFSAEGEEGRLGSKQPSFDRMRFNVRHQESLIRRSLSCDSHVQRGLGENVVFKQYQPLLSYCSLRGHMDRMPRRRVSTRAESQSNSRRLEAI
jgi:hypothetical protein